jgi:hypothetical protein
VFSVTPSGKINQNTYTPTLTGVSNVTGSTARLCYWTRVGDIVSVSGAFGLDPTAVSVFTQLDISLPVASAISDAYQVAGVAFSEALLGMGARIYGEAANDRASVAGVIGTDATNHDWSFTFSYRVI